MQSKIHRSFECNLIPATSYRSDKRVYFSNNQFMNGILTLTYCNSSFRNLRIILSDLHFHKHLSVRKIWCFSLIFFFTVGDFLRPRTLVHFTIKSTVYFSNANGLLQSRSNNLIQSRSTIRDRRRTHTQSYAYRSFLLHETVIFQYSRVQ